MRQKLILIFCLSVLSLLCVVPGAVGESAIPADEELFCALKYSFAPPEVQTMLDQQIMYKEYIEVLTNVVKELDSTRIAEWEQVSKLALNSIRPMRREDGILATYYAAEVLGLGAATNGDWWSIHQLLSEPWDDFSADFPLFPMFRQTTAFEDIPGRIAQWDHVVTGYFFCMGQFGAAGRSLFEYDAATHSMRVSDPFTWREAVLASARLYESAHQIEMPVLDVEWEAFYNHAVQKRQAAILTHETTIKPAKKLKQGETYNGKAYYVSRNGNDENSGLTPDTAWASLEKVNNAKFKKGSAIFFRRGDTWYGTLKGKAGVTYSAYGTGDKPCLAGVMDTRANHAENWILYAKGDDGRQIWTYRRDLPYVAGIFFDEGYAKHRHANWNGSDGFVTTTGGAVSMDSFLDEDLSYTSLPDLKGYESGEYVPNGHYTGPVYLRCDDGNPAEVLSNIQISLEGNGAEALGNNVTFDNLKVAYYGGCGILSGGDTYSSLLVQNCEVAYCGGFINQYNEEESGYWSPSITGGAIYLCGKGNAAVNNYIHHCDSKVFIIVYQAKDSVKNKDILMRGNLIDRSGAALYLNNFADYDNPNNKYAFHNVKFDDNYVLNTADSWCFEHQTSLPWLYKNICSLAIGAHLNHSTDIEITNNIFYLSRGALLYSEIIQENMPLFDGNTYVQYQWGRMANSWLERYFITDQPEYAKKFVTDVLQDKHAVFPYR